MEFQRELAHKIEIVDQYLEQYMRKFDSAPSPICEAMRYSLFAGGKRIRPVLAVAAYQLYREDPAPVMPFACAIEMIHTYSLIHDDLPAMDNSDLRRGRPTNHKVYGEAIAILAGDALLNAAFEIVFDADSTYQPSLFQAVRLIVESSGVYGMIGGQVMDIGSENRTIDIGELKQLHAKKTGALIRASVLSGAICAGADAKQTEYLDEFAKQLGLAFQIKDDILNVEGDTVKLGKPIGNDRDSGKNTYVSILGIPQAKELLNEHTFLAKQALNHLNQDTRFLMGLTEYLLKRDC